MFDELNDHLHDQGLVESLQLILTMIILMSD